MLIKLKNDQNRCVIFVKHGNLINESQFNEIIIRFNCSVFGNVTLIELRFEKVNSLFKRMTECDNKLNKVQFELHHQYAII